MSGTPGRRAVAVTGIGVVAPCLPCGAGMEAFWDGLHSPPASDRVRRIAYWDPVGAGWLASPKEARRLDRFTQLTIGAAALAVADSGRSRVAPADPYRGGVSLGTGIGGVGALEDQVLVLDRRGADRVSPFTVPMTMPNAGAAALSMRYGLHGPSETLATACAAGTHAVHAGARMIASGQCDLVLAGGSESSLTPTTIAAFTTMTALSKTGVSRPFDVERDGFAAGEGAAVLVLEPLEAALARGARVWMLVLGGASTSDAHHITAPSPQGTGAEACMRLALADAGCHPADVSHVNAHGTSTPLNDLAESQAITRLVGRAVPVTSIKGVTGHTLGAAGALEAAAVALSMAHRSLPPTVGTREVDPAVEVDVVTVARPWEPGVVLSNSFGFGGHNGCLVLGPPPATP